jgi:hypothetical protein
MEIATETSEFVSEFCEMGYGELKLVLRGCDRRVRKRNRSRVAVRREEWDGVVGLRSSESDLWRNGKERRRSDNENGENNSGNRKAKLSRQPRHVHELRGDRHD